MLYYSMYNEVGVTLNNLSWKQVVRWGVSILIVLKLSKTYKSNRKCFDVSVGYVRSNMCTHVSVAKYNCLKCWGFVWFPCLRPWLIQQCIPSVCSHQTRFNILLEEANFPKGSGVLWMSSINMLIHQPWQNLDIQEFHIK